MQMMIIAGIGILITGIVLFNLEKIKKAINTKDLIKKFIYLALLFGAIELLHFLLKEKIYLEAITILSLFIAAYLIIISLFIAKKRGNFFIRHFILTFFLGVVVYNYVTYPSYTYRYRMTVEVETPEGVKTGSSVVEIYNNQIPVSMAGLFGGHYNWMNIEGEGVFVEIGDGKILFLDKISNDHIMDILVDTFPIPIVDEKDKKIVYRIDNIREVMKYYGTLINSKAEVSEKNFPTMLAVVNKNNQEDIQRVNSENMEEVFGEGIKLKRVVIEMTQNAVTKNPLNSILRPKISGYEYRQTMNQVKKNFNTNN